MRIDFELPPTKTRTLLAELCVVLGFCLPHDAIARLMSNPPADADEFTNAVIRAEGLDPHTDTPRHFRRAVREIVVKHFKDAQDVEDQNLRLEVYALREERKSNPC